MKSKEELLADFLQAKNARDWEKFSSFICDDIFYELRSPENSMTLYEKEHYMEYMRYIYDHYDDTFECKRIYVSDNGKQVATILQSSRDNLSCNAYCFRDGKISEEYETSLSKW
jgi:hypothetical protein